MEIFDRVPRDRVFTWTDAQSLGLTRRDLRLLVAAGLLRQLFKGLYVGYAVELTVERRAEALAMVMPSNAVATDETAAWLHGVDLFRGLDDDGLPRLSFFQMGAHERLRNKAVTSGSRQLARTDVVRIGGVLVTTPLRTALDLARLRHPRRALAALDGLLRLGVFTIDDLVRELERFKGYRGVIQARVLVPLSDPLSESPAESWLRYEWLRSGDLPRPRPQLPIANPFSSYPWRLDLAVEDLRYAAEYDGARFHSDDDQRASDQRKRSYLRKELGWTIDVFERDDVFARSANPSAVLRAGVINARRRLGVPASEWRWPDGSAVSSAYARDNVPGRRS